MIPERAHSLPTRDERRVGRTAARACVVDLWWLACDRTAVECERAFAQISPPEQARAAAIVHPGERRRFVLARAWLREVLGRYLAVAPAALELRYGPRGKPAVRGVAGLHFSLAHAGERAVLAISRDARVGVDVEVIDPRRDVQAAALLGLSDREQRDFGALAPSARRRAFFRAWCRKEAFVKALGAGMALDPGMFSVSLGREPRLLEVLGRPAPRWRLRDLPAIPGYQGAIAVHARSFRLNPCH